MEIKKIKNKFFLLAAIALGIFLVGCEGKSDSKTLIMGCSAEYPPFEYKKNGELMGFDIDLAQAICDKLGYKLKIKDMSFDSLVAGLNAKTIDFALSGITVTPERMKHIDFSKMYYAPKFAIIYRKDFVVDNVEKMKGAHIGVQLGSTMESFLKTKIPQLGDIKIKSLKRNPDLIQELKTGRIDGVLIEKSQVEQFAKANNDLAYSILEDSAGEGYAIGFHKGSELTEKFNQALTEMNENGQLQEISNKWEL